MSGGGSGSYDLGSGRRGSSGVDQCNIVERTALNSPQPGEVRKLKPGDRLQVELRKAPDFTSLVAMRDRVIVGALTPESLVELIDCIEDGHKYQAVVSDIKGGFVTVEIRPR